MWTARGLVAAVGIAACGAACGLGATLLLGPRAALGTAVGLAVAAAGAGVLAVLSSRHRDDQATARIEALSGVVVELARRVATLEPRLASAEDGEHRGTGSELDRELNELSTLVRFLAEEVEAHDLLLGSGAVVPGVLPATAAPALPSTPPEAAAQPAAARAAPAAHGTPQPAPTAEPAGAAAVARFRDAIGRGALDLNLRPMVLLPQRRTIHYEVVAQFRDRDGAVLAAAEVAGARLGARLGGAADALVLDRALRIARRLKERQREIGVFVSASPELWASDHVGDEIIGRLHSGTTLAPFLVLQFAHAAWRRFGAIERDILAELREKGFRFALSDVHDLALDARALHAAGVRFVKVPPRLVLAKAAAPGAEIHPDDLAGFLKRNGIVLVADPVERESTVAELLDIQVAAVQGPLFGMPRPVRAEVFTDQAAAPPAPVPTIGGGLGMRVARSA